MTGGHLGPRKTILQVQRRAYFTGWRAKTYRFCRQCKPCATYFRGKLKHQACMQPMLTGNPMERMGIDLCGLFPKSYDGKLHILTCTDYFSKWTECIPIKDKQALTVAKALVDNVFSRLGCPWEIVSDQGPEFDNNLLKSLCDCFHITKLRTTPYHPNSNGVAERVHRTLNSMMGRVIGENQTDWTDHLQPLMSAYRAAVHNSTGYSPNFIMLGREVNTPLDILIKTPDGQLQQTTDKYVTQIQQVFHDCHWQVREHLQTSTNINKRYYDLSVTQKPYKIGDWVWFYKPRHVTGRTPKWERFYSGPYRIMNLFNNVNVVIQQSATSQPIICHIDKLKPYIGPQPTDFTLIGDATTTVLETPQQMQTSNGLPADSNVQEHVPVDQETITITRSNRTSRLPNKYIDYVLD